jgi:hypothetical protein
MASTAGGMVLVQARGACAIPVGHRIEVRVFLSSGGEGFFGGGLPEPMHDKPLITDLETGIRYGTFEHFHPAVYAYKGGQTFPLAAEPLPTLREHSRWFGRVLVCNVVFTAIENNEMQSTLLVEPMAPPNPGYR